jgi:hypothetical protein
VQNILAQELVQVNRFIDANGLVERSSIDPRYRRFSFLWEFKL